MTKINVPYFHLYAADLKAYKDKLSHQEFFEVHDAIADICLFGETDFNPKPKAQKMYFEKLLENFKKSIPKYRSSVENGRKGGRPRKPMGSSQVNPNETQAETIKEKKRKDNINIIKSPYDPPFEKFWEVYPRRDNDSKFKAWQAWQVSTKLAEPDEIIRAAKAYAQTSSVKEGYNKMATTWLNGRCWEEDYTVPKSRTAQILDARLKGEKV